MTNAKTLALAGAFMAFAGSAAAETKVRMLNTWDDRYPGTTVICERYAQLLTEASGGEITVQISGPETIPPLEQLEPTQAGLFQILCTYPGFHTGTSTLLTGLESIRPEPEAFRASGAMDEIRDSYGKLGLHVVSVPLAHGYWIFMNKGLSEQGDLTGRQIRALPPQHPYITAIGGTPVVLPPAEMFSALERGVIDGALFPAAGASGYGFAEVADSYLTTNISSPHVILANQAFWDGLPEDLRAVFDAQAEVLETEIPGVYDRLNAEEAEKLAAAGMQKLELDAAIAARLEEGVASGSWAFAQGRDPEAAARLQARVTEAGLLTN